MEIVIALGVGSMLMMLVANAYVGANKSQAITVGTGLLKSSGQAGLNDLYQNLHASALIFDRNSYSSDFYTRLPIKGTGNAAHGQRIDEPGLNLADVVLPDIEATGEFFTENSANVANPNWDPASVGNALLFATHEQKAVLKEEPSSTALKDAIGASEVHLSAYRLHFYFMVRRPLGTGAKPVKTGANYTYQLMHWKSEPYLDYDELRSFLLKLLRYGTLNPTWNRVGYVNTKLAKLRHPDSWPANGTGPYWGVVDFNVADPTEGNTQGLIRRLNALSNGVDLSQTNTDLFKTDSYQYAMRYNMRDNYGESFISFNTKVPTPQPTHRVPGLTVPQFAPATAFPHYGFEVMVAGEPSHRQVLLRLALAARTQPGNVMVGQAFQQVVHIFATAPEKPGATPTPTPAPTPTPGPT